MVAVGMCWYGKRLDTCPQVNKGSLRGIKKYEGTVNPRGPNLDGRLVITTCVLDNGRHGTLNVKFIR